MQFWFLKNVFLSARLTFPITELFELFNFLITDIKSLDFFSTSFNPVAKSEFLETIVKYNKNVSGTTSIEVEAERVSPIVAGPNAGRLEVSVEDGAEVSSSVLLFIGFPLSLIKYQVLFIP